MPDNVPAHLTAGRKLLDRIAAAVGEFGIHYADAADLRSRRLEMGGAERGRRVDGQNPLDDGFSPTHFPAAIDGRNPVGVASSHASSVAIFGGRALHDGRRIAPLGGLPADGPGAAKHDHAANRPCDAAVAARQTPTRRELPGGGHLRRTAVPADSDHRRGLGDPPMAARQAKSMVLAVLASSLLFAAAHYVGSAGDPVTGFPVCSGSRSPSVSWPACSSPCSSSIADSASRPGHMRCTTFRS